MIVFLRFVIANIIAVKHLHRVLIGLTIFAILEGGYSSTGVLALARELQLLSRLRLCFPLLHLVVRYRYQLDLNSIERHRLRVLFLGRVELELR